MESIRAKVKFHDVALDAIAKTDFGNTTSKFRGKGVVEVGRSGLSLHGRHLRSGTTRFSLYIVTLGIGIAFWGWYLDWEWTWDWDKVAEFIIFINIFWVGKFLSEYVFLKKEKISVSWDELKEFARGKGRNFERGYLSDNMVGISFFGAPEITPAIFSGENADAIFDFIKSLAPEKECVVPYDAITPEDYQQICHLCTAKIDCHLSACTQCGETIIPLYAFDKDANRHILKIKEMVADGMHDKQIVSALREQREKCLINGGNWTEMIVNAIRSKFSFKRTSNKSGNAHKRNTHQYKNNGEGRIYQTCPSCKKQIRIPYPPPATPGTCKTCGAKFRAILAIDGAIYLILLYVGRQGDRYEENGDNSIDSRSDLSRCLKTLGVDAAATPQEVKAAYKKRMREYHPDKVAQLGDELKKVAEQKSKEINSAYKHLKRIGRAI